jgi:hypothetical protein
MAMMLVLSRTLDRVALGMTIAAAKPIDCFEYFPGTWFVDVGCESPNKSFISIFGSPELDRDGETRKNVETVLLKVGSYYGFLPTKIWDRLR